MTPLLALRDVDAHYGDLQALFGVSLEAYEGEIVAIVGAKLRPKRRGLITNVVEDAAALFKILQLSPDFTVVPLEKHRGK